MDTEKWGNYEKEHEELEDMEPSPKSSVMIKVLAFITLVAFLALSFPGIHHLFEETLDFLKESQELDQDTIVTNAKAAIVALQTVDSVSSRSTGTGFIVSSDGKILTNAHIIEGAKSVKITFHDEEIVFSNNIELMPDLDLALIHTDKTDLSTLSWADTEAQKGDLVTIIGNPLGYDKIAQRGRVGEWYQLTQESYLVFSIDIAINPGNSGSPVLNEDGQVIGIIFASILAKEDDREVRKALAIPTRDILSFVGEN